MSQLEQTAVTILMDDPAVCTIERNDEGDMVVLQGPNDRLVARLRARDVLGADGEGSTLTIHTFKEPANWWHGIMCCPPTTKVLSTLRVQLASPELCSHWQRELAAPAAARGDFLVIVNPVSGTHKGVTIVNEQVGPMLAAAKINFTTLITSRANEATEYVKALETLSTVDTILCVGGDGTLFEVLQGIRERSDAAQILSRVKLMPIPAGTGNGLCKSITYDVGEECSGSTCTFLSITGKPQPLDLTEVQSERKYASMYAFLLLGWGLVADVDILSETMRYLGEMRLHIAAVYYIIRRRLYSGKLTIIPHTEGSASLSSDIALPPFKGPFELYGCEPSEVVSEGPFCLVWVVQTSHCTEHVYSGPECKLGSGFFTVYWVEAVSRCEMLSLLLLIDTGGHNDHPKVHSRKAVAYRIEPSSDVTVDESSGGFYTLDGEIIPHGDIQGVIRPRGCTVMR